MERILVHVYNDSSSDHVAGLEYSRWAKYPNIEPQLQGSGFFWSQRYRWISVEQTRKNYLKNSQKRNGLEANWILPSGDLT